jgi:predicted RNA binding protein YcfA (HicA-like mRNA interferase family)
VGAGNISGADVVRALRAIGFVQTSQKGSHVKLRRDSLTVIVPMHHELKEGTLRSIARQAAMTWGDFRALLA